MHPGVRLADRYRLDERVGVGGMGEVWRATDEVLGRVVAVKVVLPTLLGEPDFVRRFLVEARAMASVNHPHVAAIHDYRSDGSGAFLVMEYVEGESLSRSLNRHGRWRPADAMELVAQAADALQAVHDKDIVHRDVKPGNLLIRADGSVVLTDFGIARAQFDTAITAPGAMLGTPSYLAPEQVLGQPATALSDVYALGLVAYECVSGRRPFEGDNPFAVAMQRVREAPRTLGDLPRAVVAVIEGALATNPTQRWPSAGDLAAAARRALAELARGAGAVTDRRVRDATTTPAVAGRVGPVPRAVAPVSGRAVSGRAGLPRRRLVVLAAIAVGAVLVGAVLVGAGTLFGAGAWVRAANGPSQGATRTAGPSGMGSTGGATAGMGPAGFVQCGDLFCPPAPMCWSGLVAMGGVAREPSPVDCSEPHFWETFVVTTLPPGARSVRQDTLMERSDIADICSEKALAERSRDAAHTRDWLREPWPIQIDADSWIMHCMANSGDGERVGSEFRSGRS